MRFNIVAGEELRKIMLGFVDDPIPFNEDMSKGAYTNEPFTEGFIKERSAVHGVSADLYKEKLSAFLKMLSAINDDDYVHLYFGEDETCLANRRFLIAFLSNKCKCVYLHIVDEYTGLEIR